MTTGLLSAVKGHVFLEEIEGLIGQSDRLPVCPGADHAGAGGNRRYPVNGCIHLTRGDHLVYESPGFR